MANKAALLVLVTYLRDDADDIAPRLGRKFTDICNANSEMIAAANQEKQAHPVHHM